MSTYVALLRGINVGKAKRVSMAELRKVLEGLRYADVATLLNSGNAVFRAARGTPARMAAEIAAAIVKKLRVEVPVIVVTAAELEAIVAENPLAAEATEPSRLLVAFVQSEKSLAGLAAVRALVVPPERFVVGRHAAYFHCPSGILQSKAGDALLGKAGREATTRNWATVLKLLALARGVA